jgi:pimeloyl-ACP methyl ester carboxylesterase
MQLVKANGIEIACDITGMGPPIVLCHGGQADHNNFYNFAPVLARDFTVIAFDQRDTGETRNGEQPYTVADSGKDVGALIAALGYERAHVFGTSWGGIIAQEAAIACPERVDHLILSVTWPNGEWVASDDFYKLVRAPKETREEKLAYWSLFFSPKFSREHPDQVEECMRRVVFSRSPEQQARRGGSNTMHDQAAVRLAAVRNPTMVICGGEDQVLGIEHPRRLAAMIPGAEYVVLEGIGHANTVEAPERVAQEVRRFTGVRQVGRLACT